MGGKTRSRFSKSACSEPQTEPVLPLPLGSPACLHSTAGSPGYLPSAVLKRFEPEPAIRRSYLRSHDMLGVGILVHPISYENVLYHRQTFALILLTQAAGGHRYRFRVDVLDIARQ